MIYMTDEYQAQATLFDWPLTHSRILWDNVLAAAAFTAGSVREGFEAVRARSSDTVSWWWPTAAAALTAVMPAAREVNCIALAAHNLGTTGASLTASARVGGVWRVVHPTITPSDDEPIMLAFETVEADAIRVAVSGPAMIGVIYAGKLMVMPHQPSVDVQAIPFSRATSYETNRSMTGQFMGRSVESTSRPVTITWSFLRRPWVAEVFDKFILSARESPFFMATRPGRHPDDIGYILTDADVIPAPMGVQNFMTVTLTGEAHAGPQG